MSSPNEHQFRGPSASDGWGRDHAADDWWNREGIRMPSSRHPYTIPRNSLETVIEHIGKDLQQFSSLRIKREPMNEPLQLVFEDLPYIPYETSRQSTASSTTPDIYFRVSGQSSNASDRSGINAFPLSKALSKDLSTLCDRQMMAPLGDVSAKLSIRIQFPHCVPYSRQIMARRSTSTSEPISMEILAHKIAKEVDKCLTETKQAGRPLVHKRQVVRLEDLYLWRLKKVSPGSWVPEFKVFTSV